MAAKKKAKKKEGSTAKVKVPEKGTKADRLRAFADQCNAALGTSGAVYVASSARTYRRVRTGITALDYTLGGGIVRGQLVQFTGSESSFKSTAAMIAVASVQAEDGLCVWVAGEGFDRKWAECWGVDLDRLIIVTADMGDVALEAAVTLIQSKLVDLIVFDSYQSLGTTREIDSGIDDEAYAGAGAPQMWGRVMRKMYAAMNSGADTAMIGISQVRAAIGKFSPNGAPDPEGSGIYALKHWKGVDIYFKKGEQVLEGAADERRRVIKRTFKLKCVKNKTAPTEGTIASFVVGRDEDGHYIDNVESIMRLASANGLIVRRGAWYEGYGIKAQGEEKFVELLREDEDAQDQIIDELMEQVQ